MAEQNLAKWSSTDNDYPHLLNANISSVSPSQSSDELTDDSQFQETSAVENVFLTQDDFDTAEDNGVTFKPERRSCRRNNSSDNLNGKSTKAVDRRYYTMDTTRYLNQIKVDVIKVDTPAELPTKKGYLMKKSGTSIVGWQKRWLHLQSRRLLYFKTAEDDHPSGVLDFDLLKIELLCQWNKYGSSYDCNYFIGRAKRLSTSPSWSVLTSCCCRRERSYEINPKQIPFGIDPETEVNFILKPYGSIRVFEFKGPFYEVEEWVRFLQKHMAAATQIADPLIVATQKKYWAIDRIPVYKFEEVACTGDVILFKTRKVFSRVQRAFTRAFYDHVALIIKKADGTIFLLEALGNCGVCLTDWRTFVDKGWMSQYKRMALRRLFCNRTSERLENLIKFCFAHVGKPYGLSFGKLLRSNSLTVETPDFFCSELVAQAWKAMSVLKKDKITSTQVWPGSFAQSTTDPLPLEDDCSISQELMIDFSLGSVGRLK